MGLIDIIILVLIVIGAIQGFTKGFIHQLASILGLIVGFFIARVFYLVVAEKLIEFMPDAPMTILQIVAFISIWLIVPLLFVTMAWFFTRALNFISLGAFNRLLGLLLGAAKWVLIIGLFINIIDYIDPDNRVIGQTKKEASMLYYPIKHIVSSFFPVAKEITNDYISV